jgi:hypothetical protein
VIRKGETDVAKEEDPTEKRNVIEVHIRDRTERMMVVLRELKALIDRNQGVADLITIDTHGGPIDVTPTVEKVLEKKPTMHRLVKGNIYLIKSEDPNRGFETFADVIRSQCHDCSKAEAFSCEALNCSNCTIGCPCSACDLHRPQGLCLTRRFPKKVAQEYLIQTTPIIWLTQMRRNDVDCISPHEIARINLTLTSFIEKSENGVIMFEGLEYLITQNSFDLVLNFIQHLQDIISTSKSCFVFLLDPLALDPEQVHLLQKNMTEL